MSSKKAKPQKPIFRAVRLSNSTESMVRAIGYLTDMPVREQWYAVIVSEPNDGWAIEALLGESLFRHFFAWVDKENPSDFAEVVERKFT